MFNILNYPLVTHFLLALLYTVVLAFGLYPVFDLTGVLVASLIVSTFFYGREAGQREHDLKNASTNPYLAWLGSEFFFMWSGSNRWQWVSPMLASLLVLLGFAVWRVQHLVTF